MWGLECLLSSRVVMTEPTSDTNLSSRSSMTMRRRKNKHKEIKMK